MGVQLISSWYLQKNDDTQSNNKQNKTKGDIKTPPTNFGGVRSDSARCCQERNPGTARWWCHHARWTKNASIYITVSFESIQRRCSLCQRHRCYTCVHFQLLLCTPDIFCHSYLFPLKFRICSHGYSRPQWTFKFFLHCFACSMEWYCVCRVICYLHVLSS